MNIDEEFLNNFIFLVFILFALLLLIAMINKYSSHDEPEEIIHIDKENLRTGDILAISYSNLAGAFVSSFSNSIWSHTGIVWRDPDTHVIFVLEGAVYPLKSYKGFIRIPFDIWYSYNKCFILGLKQYQGDGIDSDQMIKIFEKYEGKVKLEGLNPSWGRFLMTRDYFKNKNNKTYTCFEFTIRLLHEINVYKKEKLHCSYFPKHIMNDSIPYNNGHNYSSVKRFFLTPTVNRLLNLEKSHFQKN